MNEVGEIVLSVLIAWALCGVAFLGYKWLFQRRLGASDPLAD